MPAPAELPSRGTLAQTESVQLAVGLDSALSSKTRIGRATSQCPFTEGKKRELVDLTH